MKVLSIGNSFSQDAHKWLHKLAKVNGVDLETANLFIGGCSLETHWNNASNNNEHYDLERNGNNSERKISISEALQMEDWDVVTVQQVSNLSGLPESYEPYLSNLVSVIKDIRPNAKLYFHQTWAYEMDSTNEGFATYNNDQQLMYNSIISTTEKVAKSINAGLIPTGRVIQYLRENTSEFDYKNGGVSLCRDGCHLSLDYGRYTAAATWLATLTGTRLTMSDFEDFNLEYLKKINTAVNEL